MYNPRNVVGGYFEELLSHLLDLVRTDLDLEGNVPDLVSRNHDFYVEVKASSYTNGGVINQEQLYRFDREIDIRRFYAFVYHSINNNMTADHPTKKSLRKALDLRSLFLFPFSIAKAHFERSHKVKTPKHDTYVQLKEGLARKIFDKDEQAWDHLQLNPGEYHRSKPRENIHILTRHGHLKKEILQSLRL